MRISDNALGTGDRHVDIISQEVWKGTKPATSPNVRTLSRLNDPPTASRVNLSLTAALDVAPVGRWGHAVIAPPATIDLKDAIVDGTIRVVVDRRGLVV